MPHQAGVDPNASLSPHELNTLRALKQDFRRAISGEDRKLLLRWDWPSRTVKG
jgi:hypothetical protein